MLAPPARATSPPADRRLRQDQTADDDELGDADGGDEHDEARALEQPGEERLLDDAAERRGRRQRQHEGEPVVEVGVAGEGEHHRHRERAELAVGEVDDPVRHVDEHEPRQRAGRWPCPRRGRGGRGPSTRRPDRSMAAGIGAEVRAHDLGVVDDLVGRALGDHACRSRARTRGRPGSSSSGMSCSMRTMAQPVRSRSASSSGRRASTSRLGDARRRLVEEHDLRALEQEAGEVDDAARAGRQLADELVAVGLEAEGLDLLEGAGRWPRPRPDERRVRRSWRRPRGRGARAARRRRGACRAR